jgi:hypothetical protein
VLYSKTARAEIDAMSAPPQGQVPTFKLILVGDGGTGARRDATRARMRAERDRTTRIRICESETENEGDGTRGTRRGEDEGDGRRGRG